MKQTDFVHTQGRDIIDEHGNKLLLRGVGLGGWLLPEGYMWRFPNQGDRPRKIEKVIASLIGEEEANLFWHNYYENYIAKEDIDKIAQDGFNSVRIPLHWRFLLDKNHEINEKHWQLLDEIIQQCELRKVYVILDLHGAPGGQTGANIDDCENDIPELFIHEVNQDLTVFIWKELAKRYKDSPIIACYDLFNEPVPEFHGQYNDKVYPMYKRLIDEIRAIDPYHMITLEGIHWSTDWSIFTHKLDDNVLYQFHKYWNNPDAESLSKFLFKRDEWDVPIFMGEGGENNKEWYSGAFAMYEDLDISWNFWTYKKMDTTNSMVSIIKPKDWDRLTDYMEKKADLSNQEAKAIFSEYLNNIKLENCVLVDEVVNYLFRRPNIEIPAIFYNWDSQAKVQTSKGLNVGYRSEDNRDILFLDSSRIKPNFQHGRGESWKDEEWLCVKMHENDSLHYWFTSTEKQVITLSLTLLNEKNSRVVVSLNEKKVDIDLNSVGHQIVYITSDSVDIGKSKIQVELVSGGISLISVNIKKEQ
ncbi:MAG: cellulase family glycosylhydrolase [Erysipelotrichaceae bacterium]|nr:cellulase family glycosylhydrolase [Erysipelotrichaceae bacterium]